MTQTGPGFLQALGPLAARGWLADRSDDFRAWAARVGRWASYAKGQSIYEAGDPGDALHGLGEGALHVTFPLVADEPVVIHRGEAGFWIGESAVLARGRRTVSLHAATPARVFRIPAAAIWAELDRRPERWCDFYALSHDNTETAVMLLAEALALSPKARLARVLLRLAGPDGVVEASQGELARLIGMTRTTLHRSVTELVASGALETGYGRLRVRDGAGLERAAAEA